MDILSDILSLMRIKGTLYFRTDFSAPFGVQVPSYANVARFHLVCRGHVWLTLNDEGETMRLEKGDMAVVMNGAAHILSSSQATSTEALALDEVVEKSGYCGEGALSYGGNSGENTETAQLICGHFSIDKDANHPLLAALPAHIHISSDGSEKYRWLESTLRLIGGQSDTEQLGRDLISFKLAELLFAESIRYYLSEKGRDSLVFKGLNDTHISSVLKDLHGDPTYNWDLEEMAKRAGLSRTNFAARFHEVMGVTPRQYLIAWRMQIGRDLLVYSEQSILRVAERCGYRSEAAFGRVFKRHFDQGPASYRRNRLSESKAA